MIMDEREIVYEYKTAKNPRRQIYILAQLNQVDKNKIIDILTRNGQLVSESHLQSGSGNKLSQKTIEKITDFYDAGYTDAEISRALSLGHSTVSAWRKRNSLEANPAHRIPTPIYNERVRLYHEGLTDRQIAEKTGLTVEGIASWRKRNKLKANKKEGK